MAGRRLKEYFSFTKRERNGVIVLLFLLIILFFVEKFIDFSSDKEISLMNEKYQKQINEFEESLEEKSFQIEQEKKRQSYLSDKNAQESHWKIPDSLFYFDPNTITEKQLQALGLTQKQIATLINYRNAGGDFVVSSDFLKIYGIEEEQYTILEPYILIADTKEQSNKEQHKIVAKENIAVILEINSSSADSLELLKGIGPVYAQRIIKYRELLGGYNCKSQLYEVYGLDSALINSIYPQIIIDTSLIKKLNINKADFTSLINHLNLNKYYTQAILNYKEIQGGFNSIDELVKNNLLPEDVFLKLKPYLDKE